MILNIRRFLYFGVVGCCFVVVVSCCILLLLVVCLLYPVIHLSADDGQSDDVVCLGVQVHIDRVGLTTLSGKEKKKSDFAKYQMFSSTRFLWSSGL